MDRGPRHREVAKDRKRRRRAQSDFWDTINITEL